ncbi:TPA: LOW QUALITY PROTEIN: hypothetical protein N0F65_006117 [Lagenidium giganteum]|uniref:4Fe-4S ferredoxin-type domain-containing protein n=1 Tax=Lagenidium giganteum TaxID=4803 RepID=A0AAV2Z592_9STRA|nr:TPA: LOW QUALITY PROTEIN: hypothetical protein N0F65_006117 [Lagenidium giganteum]
MVRARVFTFPSDPREQNSYVVGTMEGGTLPIIGTIKVEDEELQTITFAQMRPRIELKEDGGMVRRSLMFQEVLAIIAASPNPHRWPRSSFQTYWFGYFSDEEATIPNVIAAADENSPISQFLNMTTSKQTGDLVLIPQTQLGPVCEKCCQGCSVCPPIVVDASARRHSRVV